MQVHLMTIVCKFGRDPAICLREEAICAKVYRQTDGRTDGRTDNGRLAMVLAHSWNELLKNCSLTTCYHVVKLQFFTLIYIGLGLNLKIRHDAIVRNVVTNVYT